jgi:hypothetical protein
MSKEYSHCRMSLWRMGVAWLGWGKYKMCRVYLRMTHILKALGMIMMTVERS